MRIAFRTVGRGHIKRLARRPGVANPVRQIRADMAEADHAYAQHKFFGYTSEQFTENVPPTLMMWQSLDAHPFQLPAE